jgi:hypothetical protein
MANIKGFFIFAILIGLFLALKDGKLIRRGGVKWVIKDGIIYHAPTLLEDVKKIVTEAQ